MKITLNQSEGLYTDEQALRLTALSYLKEALVKERYEECAELIAAAKRFGATQRDIRVNIAQSVRRLKFGAKADLFVTKVARRRF